MTKPKFHVKMTEPQIRKSFPILWSLNSGENVDNAHTPSRKQFGNRQEVSKANSAKGSLAKGMIKPKMSTNSVTQHHSRYSRKYTFDRQKERSHIKMERAKIILSCKYFFI